MIKSREEYELVTIEDGILINGEIMPLRKDDQKNILRGEDPAFCSEAVNAIDYTLNPSIYPNAGLNTNITSAITSYPYSHSSSRIRNLASREYSFVKPKIDVKSQLFKYDRSNPKTHLCDYFPGINIDDELKSDYVDFDKGILRRDSVEALFHDISKRLRLTGRLGITVEEGSSSNTYGGSNPNVKANGATIIRHYAIKGTTSSSTFWGTAVADGGDMIIDDTSTTRTINLRFAGTNAILANVIRISYAVDTTSIAREYVYVQFLKEIKDGDRFPRKTMAEIVKKVIEEQIGPFMKPAELPTSSGGSSAQSISAIVQQPFVVISLGDRFSY